MSSRRLALGALLLAGMCLTSGYLTGCLGGGQTGEDAVAVSGPGCVDRTVDLATKTSLGSTPRELAAAYSALPDSKSVIQEAFWRDLGIAPPETASALRLELGEATAATEDNCRQIKVSLPGEIVIQEVRWELRNAKLLASAGSITLDATLTGPSGIELALHATAADRGWMGTIRDRRTNEERVEFSP